MPAQSPPVGDAASVKLRKLGARLRARRKELGLSAVATAEAAGLSRVTLNRIEQGEASVTIGAYMSVADALGLELDVSGASPPGESTVPSKIRPTDYPQLGKLAWQLDSQKELSPAEALALYERNWRHIDQGAMEPRERELVAQLLAAFGRERLLV